MKIAAVSGIHPDHYASQDELIDALETYWANQHHNAARLRRFHEAVKVGGRYLACPLEDYPSLDTFGKTNDAYIREGTRLAIEATRQALAQVGLTGADVDAVFQTSVTGIATPSIEARIHGPLGLRPDVKRTPIFGLGCVGGAAGIARVFDYLKAWPDQVAVLLSIELCSLTLQRQDLSVANLISSGLFGDGVAAVVCVGEERARKMGLSGPSVTATVSSLYPDSLEVMGWDISESGFKVVLDASVPDMVLRYLADDVDGFLGQHDLARSDIRHWIAHTGGPKILMAIDEALDLPEGSLDLTWESLRREGNMSSASVLFVLRDLLAKGIPNEGDHGLLFAMGPGFCSELVLMRWDG